VTFPDAAPSPDLAIGAFTENGPWRVDPESMPWRTGIDQLRAETQAQVPSLVDRRRAPALRLAKVGAIILGAVGPWAVRKRLNIGAPTTIVLARRLRRAFERLGTTYIKLGQIVASADGMLPPDLVQEFKACRDEVPAETFETVRSIVESDLGHPLEDIFASFDREPIAAASIAQVHAARLHTGEAVVVKVQRPRVAKIVPADLRTMSWLAPILVRRVPQLALVNLPAYIELFAETIVEELDFRLEAQNMLDIAAVLAKTDQRAVVVPRPHPELVTRRVLVMERLHGFKIDDQASMRAAGVDPSEVFTSLMVSFFEGAGIFGVFHGDLHGGNMIVTADGKAGIFDFGITGRFDDVARTALMKLLLGGLTEDVTEQIRSFRDLGGFPPDADLDAIAAEIDIEQLRSAGAEASPEEMAAQMQALVKQLLDHGAKLPKPLFLYMKGMIYLNGAIAALASDVNILDTLGKVFTYFAESHGDVFTNDFGVDLSGIAFDELIQAQMGGQLGVDVKDGISFNELSEVNARRMEEIRESRRG
jgi:ubiquinone biosynthesis protein